MAINALCCAPQWLPVRLGDGGMGLDLDEVALSVKPTLPGGFLRATLNGVLTAAAHGVQQDKLP
jgi:hypothetical protein